MANLREIKKRITSVTSTKQITRTMEMVSTAKIRRALDRAYGAEPYKKALTDVMLTVAQDTEAAGDAPLLHKHDREEHVLVVAIASDRGLAGGAEHLVTHEPLPSRTAVKHSNRTWSPDGERLKVFSGCDGDDPTDPAAAPTCSTHARRRNGGNTCVRPARRRGCR